MPAEQTTRGPGIGNDQGFGMSGGPGTGKGAGRGPGMGGGRGEKSKRKGRGQQRDKVLYPRVVLDEAQALRVLVCVDDTDDVDGATSTGYVAEQIAQAVVQLGGNMVLGITRHQLLLDENVPYTSHNSSMCFEALLPACNTPPTPVTACNTPPAPVTLDPAVLEGVPAVVAQLYAASIAAIQQHSAPVADPGLCIAWLDVSARGQEAVSQQISGLCDFGRRAQKVVCTKEEAYALAQGIPWLVLSEHGGTGQGIIGALAGVGLRLSGEDGRFRGSWELDYIFECNTPPAPVTPFAAHVTSAPVTPGTEGAALSVSGAEAPDVPDVLVAPDVPDAPDAPAQVVFANMKDPVMPAGEICSKLEPLVGGQVRVLDENGTPLPLHTPVRLDQKVKPVLREGALCILCTMQAVPSAEVARSIDNGLEAWGMRCASFEFDNDLEECDPQRQQLCCNCLYRRWTTQGFSCMKDERNE